RQRRAIPANVSVYLGIAGQIEVVGVQVGFREYGAGDRRTPDGSQARFRSNAINIGMTKLPQPRSIKTAILKMDATIMNREGIEKLLTMLPTEEERTKIQEAQAANPDLPLGSAEQFLLTLASISDDRTPSISA
ncbi:Formin Homology 2 Domain, partial [Popillia japonica]